MAENNAPQNRQDDELSVEELEGVAGGDGVQNQCPITNFSNCAGCGSTGISDEQKFAAN